MKTKLFVLLIFLLASLTLFGIDTPKGFETERVVLYQSNETLQTRISAVTNLANYIKQLQAVCVEFLAATETPETLHIVVAVRPDKRARVWFVSSAPAATDPKREPLRKKLEAVTPLEVHPGPVAFAISAKLAGGDGKNSKGDKDVKLPIPKEWQDAATGKENLLVPDGFLDLVWPYKK